jgi:diguanylate cyclase (GGDEF)-like protein
VKKTKSELWIILFAILMFSIVSIMALVSIQHQHGNARVVNYVGIVRGATQRLVKEELRGEPDDKLIRRLDGIVKELISGGQENGLTALADPDFQSNMALVQERWGQLKEQILFVRGGGDDQELYDQSQAYFDLANDTVFKAESYSELQVIHSTRILMGCNIFFVLILAGGLFYVMRMRAVRRRADTLSRIAYIDVLTGLPNRARCEQVCQEYDKAKPVENVAVFMFDMNNLKIVNDKFGHKKGDEIIRAFSDLLKRWAEGRGFVGRYGGDEFLAVLGSAGNGEAAEQSARINALVESYNADKSSKLERVSFALGFHVDNLSVCDMESMILMADRNMYDRKRQMKEAMLD